MADPILRVSHPEALASGVGEARASVIVPRMEALPPALETGHQQLDGEHRMLLTTIAALRQVCVDHVGCENCSACSEASRNQCEGNLIAMLGDLLSFILDHFKLEEAVMRDSLLQIVDREVCNAHIEDHAAISGKVQEIVSALNPLRTVSLIRELDALLMRWLENHIGLHDMLLLRWLEREDSVLRLA